MHTAAAALPVQAHPHFLFEERSTGADGRSALTAMAASVLLHVPLLPLVGLWAPEADTVRRVRDVTALFEALAEEERIVPVDLETLGGGEATTAAADTGPAPGAQSLTDNPCARGSVSTAVPAPPARDVEGAAVTASVHGEDSEQLGPALTSRLPAPDAIARRAGGRGTSGLTPEEERAMRQKWFAWYRGVLGERLFATYPRAELEARGVRGQLAFKLDLAPNGEVKACDVVQADAPEMRDALASTLKRIGRFPSYAATGLPFFPPFLFRIQHGPGEWKPADGSRDTSTYCALP
jgi:hypothetical protein